jgi:sodium/bile acid cotransporter 7
MKETLPMWIPLLAAALVACLACARTREPDGDAAKLARIEAYYAKYRRKFPDVEEISAEELVRRLGEDDLVLVDVRTQPEREVSMLPGAITSEELEADPERYAGKTLVTYCTAGYRSGLFARKLDEKGWEVLNLKGSLLSWSHTGEPLEHDGEPTRRVHTYGPDWDLLAEGYEAIW